MKEVDINSNITRVQIAKKLNIPVTILNGITAKRDFILNSSQSSQKIRVKKGKYEVMEKKLLIWFKQARSASIPVSRPILREKAQEIAKKME